MLRERQTYDHVGLKTGDFRTKIKAYASDIYFKMLRYRLFILLLNYWLDSIYHNQWEKDFFAENMNLQPEIKNLSTIRNLSETIA